MIDTHCHIYLEQFDEDLTEVLDRAREAGVKEICMPAITFESLNQMELIHHPEIAFHKMAGIHPCDVGEIPGKFEQQLYDHCSKEEIIAVGETGLDYYWSQDWVNNQKTLLRIHCKVAKELDKPVVLHNRESTTDLLDIIEEQQDGRLRGVWHCYTGTVDEGNRALELNLHLGVGGVTTFKNAGVDQTVAEMPMQKLILETDAPFLAPHPKRGKRNEPAFMKFTAEKLAEIKGMSLDEVDEVTTETAKGLFNLP